MLSCVPGDCEVDFTFWIIITFVVVTHELLFIFTIADRVIVLDKPSKSIIADGDPRQLRDNSPHAFMRQFLVADRKSVV